MCIKLSPGNLNPSHFSTHPTNTYTCEVTIAPKVCDGEPLLIFKKIRCFYYIKLTRFELQEIFLL